MSEFYKVKKVFDMILHKGIEASIVISQNATPREKFAAEELQKYIKMIFGAELAVCSDAETLSKNIISIGGPEKI